MPIQLRVRRAAAGLAGDPAGADDDGEASGCSRGCAGERMAAQLSRRAVSMPAAVSRREQQHGGPRLVGVVQEEDGGHHEQRQQHRALDDGDQFLAEAAQAVDGVLAGEAVGDGGEQQTSGRLRQHGETSGGSLSTGSQPDSKRR